MPDISTTYGNAALTGGLTPSTTYYFSLHTADPGTTGANEVAGGGYARQPIQFGTPSGLIQSSTDSQTFTLVPAVSGNLWSGVWSAVSSGTFFIGDPNATVTGPIPANATVTFSAGAFSIVAF